MPEFDSVVDSGKRENFDTGSIRDVAAGKGMPHLIAGTALSKILDMTRNFDDYQTSKLNMILDGAHHSLLNFNDLANSRQDRNDFLNEAAKCALLAIYRAEDNSIFRSLKRFAMHYENGAKKYAANNWRKGQPVSRYYDSAMRHLWLAMDNDITEDHLAALLWNLTCMIQTKLDVESGYLPEQLDDFPFLVSEIFIKKAEKCEK